MIYNNQYPCSHTCWTRLYEEITTSSDVFFVSISPLSEFNARRDGYKFICEPVSAKELRMVYMSDVEGFFRPTMRLLHTQDTCQVNYVSSLFAKIFTMAWLTGLLFFSFLSFVAILVSGIEFFGIIILVFALSLIAGIGLLIIRLSRKHALFCNQILQQFFDEKYHSVTVREGEKEEKKL